MRKLSHDRLEYEPGSAARQPLLPFDGDGAHAAVTSSAAPHIDQGAEPAAGPDVSGCLDPDDPDADLETMSDEELLGHTAELRGGPDAAVRRLKAIVLLQGRGVLAEPRWARLAAVDRVPAKPRDEGWPRKVRFRTALDRVTKTGAVLAAERFAEWLAEDLYDTRSISDFRTIARGLRDGVLTRELVSEAYRRARCPGVRNRSAFFRRWVWDRSPWGAARRRATRR
jgi:hypothetical protein